MAPNGVPLAIRGRNPQSSYVKIEFLGGWRPSQWRLTIKTNNGVDVLTGVGDHRLYAGGVFNFSLQTRPQRNLLAAEPRAESERGCL